MHRDPAVHCVQLGGFRMRLTAVANALDANRLAVIYTIPSLPASAVPRARCKPWRWGMTRMATGNQIKSTMERRGEEEDEGDC
jgi:hypothetical protein